MDKKFGIYKKKRLSKGEYDSLIIRVEESYRNLPREPIAGDPESIFKYENLINLLNEQINSALSLSEDLSKKFHTAREYSFKVESGNLSEILKYERDALEASENLYTILKNFRTTIATSLTKECKYLFLETKASTLIGVIKFWISRLEDEPFSELQSALSNIENSIKISEEYSLEMQEKLLTLKKIEGTRFYSKLNNFKDRIDFLNAKAWEYKGFLLLSMTRPTMENYEKIETCFEKARDKLKRFFGEESFVRLEIKHNNMLRVFYSRSYRVKKECSENNNENRIIIYNSTL